VEPRHREPDGETADGSGWATAMARFPIRELSGGWGIGLRLD
jgi:hypothetical protein